MCDYRGYSHSVQNMWKTGEPREEKPAREPGIPAVRQEPGWRPGSPTHRGRVAEVDRHASPETQLRSLQARGDNRQGEAPRGASEFTQELLRGAECLRSRSLPQAGLPHHPRVPPAGTEGAAPGVPAPGVVLSRRGPRRTYCGSHPTGTLNKAVKEMV